MAVRPEQVDGRRATERFGNLTYDDFRVMARDEALSAAERIGFPDALREGLEAAILADIRAKLPRLDVPNGVVVDIGIGCGALAEAIVRHTASRSQRLVAVDAPEVLERLSAEPHVKKLPGRFPSEVRAALAASLPGGADAVIAYDVLQVVYLEANPFEFVDAAASLLAPGAALLVGDVPNQSKLRRFLASERGRDFHRTYMQTGEDPVVEPFTPAPGRLDDGVVLGLVQRARAAGYDAYLVPQPEELPLSNRREDLLIVRP